MFFVGPLVYMGLTALFPQFALAGFVLAILYSLWVGITLQEEHLCRNIPVRFVKALN